MIQLKMYVMVHSALWKVIRIKNFFSFGCFVYSYNLLSEFSLFFEEVINTEKALGFCSCKVYE